MGSTALGLSDTQLDFFEEPQYMRLGRDGKVYYITRTEALLEEKVEIAPESEWDRLVREANRLGDFAVKVHHQMYYTNKDTVLPALRRAHRTAMLKYTELVAALAYISPDLVRQLLVKCLERQHFLERKLDMMQRMWRERLFGQFQKTLLQYEVTYEQAQALSVGVEAG